MEDNYQFRQAMELLKLGMQSGAIKLRGVNHAQDAVEDATADAAYITAFLQHLMQVLPAE